MTKKRWLIKHWFWVLCALLLLVAACAQGGRSASETADFGGVAEPAMEFEESEEAMDEEMEEEMAEFEGEEAIADEDAFAADDAGEAANDAPSQQSQPQQRLIIKDGNMTITVDDTETAVNQATDLAVSSGGYIISQTVFDDPQGFRYATMRLGVPVDSFEVVMRALRNIGEVTNESASGEDVTDQFFDLSSRLDNLTATRDRLRDFLNDANDVDEALRVNTELRQIEEEIAVIQGRLNYLADRAAFSTIDLTLNPIVPTPTPTATPTATPIPTAEGWRPGDTARVAAVELQETAQNVADFTIYTAIAVLPWLLFWGFVGYVLYRVGRRIFRRESVARTSAPIPPTEPTDNEEDQS